MIKTFTKISTLLGLGLLLMGSQQAWSQDNATITVVDQLCDLPGSITVEMTDKVITQSEDFGVGQTVDIEQYFTLATPLNNVSNFILNTQSVDDVNGYGVLLSFYDSNGIMIWSGNYYYDPLVSNQTINIGTTLNDVASVIMGLDWYSYVLNDFYFSNSNYTYSWTPFPSDTNVMNEAYMGSYSCTATNVNTGQVYYYPIMVGQVGQDIDGDGYDCFSDCDDLNPNAFPGNSPDICDVADNDCDGTFDEDGSNTDPNVVPTAGWGLYSYNGIAFDEYRGWYDMGPEYYQKTSDEWADWSSPSYAPNYEGCYTEIDNHSYKIKRQGFPAGDYLMRFDSFDDDINFLVDNVTLYFSTCCGWGSTMIGPFTLTENSVVEIDMIEYGGGSNVNFELLPAVYGCTDSYACNYNYAANVNADCQYYPTVTGWSDITNELNFTLMSTGGISYTGVNDTINFMGSGGANFYNADTLLLVTTVQQTMDIYYNFSFTMNSPAQTDSTFGQYGVYLNGNYYNDAWNFTDDNISGNNWTVGPGDTFGFYLYYNTNLSAPYTPDYHIYNLYIDRPCVGGCIDPAACNFMPFANNDDGSCILPVAEICNNQDDDCNGFVDEGLVYNTYYIDNDQDAWGTDFYATTCENLIPAFAVNSGDCDDTNSAINPGMAEINDNSIDDDCNPNTPDVSVNELSANSHILAFPNPTHNELNLVVTNNLIGAELVMYDAVGNALSKQVITNANTHIATSTLANGNYFVRVAGQTIRFTVVH